MFEKILIANRGEIACRVARTASRLGIKTVAVYSDADAHAMHVSACDEAYLIGPAAAADSYLRADKILEVAKQSGAQAIHPGYGFLSENAGFAKACADAGICFIGPPASAIIAMGSKSEAKTVMTEAGVPLVPGYHGDEQDAALLKAESLKIGFPQLIKATAGGGGKGMRVVNSADEFEAALVSCRREAMASFGDDNVLIERYLTAPRHVELQVFADTHGNAVHLFERDCSIQRRHQKVIEEAPAPGMSEALRTAMGNAAIDSAKAIQYVGAGTVEFLLDTDGSFYFMEMNTRLQVEHPVSEMISGQDLVEWQLRVASGEPLPLTQDQLTINGHAFEARIYAEAPDRDFLPATGTLSYLKTPERSGHVRVDTGVTQGDAVSRYYDPMIAKLITWDTDRDSALRQMKAALRDYQILGLSTNIEFLSRLFTAPKFAAGEFDTGFIEKHHAALFPERTTVPHELIALTTLYKLLSHHRQAAAQASPNDPASPWVTQFAWRMNQIWQTRLSFTIDKAIHTVAVQYHGDEFVMTIAGEVYTVSGEMSDDNQLSAVVNNQRLSAAFLQKDQDIHALFAGKQWQLSHHDPRLAGFDSDTASGGLLAPMPGAVVSVLVEAGDPVKAGDALLVVEAMKMEHTIVAPDDGTVADIFYQVGDQVEDGDELIHLNTAE